MARVVYSSTKFVKPDPIPETQFWAIKKRLSLDPNFDFVPETESFSQHFSGLLKWMGGSFVVMIIGFSLGEGVTTMIGGLAMISFFLIVFFLFLEGPSYATFLRKKNDYFSRMRTSIQESDSYDDFVNQFYIK